MKFRNKQKDIVTLLIFYNILNYRIMNNNNISLQRHDMKL